MANADRGMPMSDALGYPYVAAREELHKAGRTLGNALRDDLAFAADAD